MRFLVIGASGRTGRLILRDALSRKHTVTALVRNPSSLSPAPGLTIISGSPLNTTDIESAIKSSVSPPDAVIIALASVRASDNPFAKPISPPRLMTESHERVLAAMKKFGIKRLVTISGFGVGDSNRNVFFPMRMILNHSNIAYAYSDHNAVETLVRKIAADAKEGRDGESGGLGEGWQLQWTLVRPMMLNDGESKEVKVLGNQGKGAGMLAAISRASVASFVIRHCIESGEFVLETPVICE